MNLRQQGGPAATTYLSRLDPPHRRPVLDELSNRLTTARADFDRREIQVAEVHSSLVLYDNRNQLWL